MQRPGPVLFRRRQVWLPTALGWVVLLALGLGCAVAMAASARGLLSPNEPATGADGGGAQLFVVEGWLRESDLIQAVKAFQRGRYAQVITTGGPIEARWESPEWTNYAERAADYLRASGLSEVPITAVPAPASAQDRTFLSAVILREWAATSGLTLLALDLYSSGVHARRSRMLFRLALGPSVEVGILSSTSKVYDADRWWTSSAGTRAVVGEALGLGWTLCCFWPPPQGSHEERWGR